MKTLISVTGTDASKAGVEWCAQHLSAEDDIVVVGSFAQAAEFMATLPAVVNALPPVTAESIEHTWCTPLARAGLRWRMVFAHDTQRVAVANAIEDEHPDLVVVGEPSHVTLDLLLHGELQHVLHQARCPVLLVPHPT
jgi:hypothetical protein